MPMNAEKEHWEEYWKNYTRKPVKQRKKNILRDAYGLIKKLMGPPTMSTLVYKILQSHIGYQEKKQILEAGSGSGEISAMLTKHGHSIFLLDISLESLRFAEKSLEGNHVYCVNASILAMPFKENAFDVVWNAGVLEHFEDALQGHAVSEMMRVCNKNGLFITLNPYEKAFIYRWMKAYAEKRGRWALGYEKPVLTLKRHFKNISDDPSAFHVREFSAGFLTQFYFLNMFFKNKFLASLFVLIIEALNKLFMPLNKLPGYFIVTTAKKISNIRTD